MERSPTNPLEQKDKTQSRDAESRMIKCYACNGTGTKDGKTCSSCDGKGEVRSN
jgi:DnaJ-class molecular chaperone